MFKAATKNLKLCALIALGGCAVRMDGSSSSSSPPKATSSTTTSTVSASKDTSVALVSTSPSSPSNSSTTPIVIGTAGADVAAVRLYSDSNCITLIGSALRAIYVSAGATITATSNAATSIYAVTVDTTGATHACTLIGSYTHDDTAPNGPGYSSTDPATPTNSTTSIEVIGTVPSDASTVELFSENTCSNQIGSGSATLFATTGLTASVTANTVTPIYAQTVDAAGNYSACTLMLNFTHDSIGPVVPVFVSTSPSSPSNSDSTPEMIGSASADTVTVSLFSESSCVTQVGTGTKTTFEGAGITATGSTNTTNTFYAIAYDSLGNASSCTSMVDYVHDSLAPNGPGFLSTNPSVPVSSTTTVTVIGTVPADAVGNVSLYSDSGCSASLASGTIATFTGAGISVSLTANNTTTVYATVSDSAGNTSACTHLVSAVHDNTGPSAPVYISTNPSSPSNTSTTPSVIGTSSADTVNVSVFDDVGCSSQIGTDTKAAFESTGVGSTVTSNTSSVLYAIAYDSLSNASACTLMTTYVHDTLAPANPGFSSTNPTSPSSSSATPLVIGTAAADVVTLTVYSDAGCTSSIGSGTRASFVGAGITASVSSNALTSIYAVAVDSAGNLSSCTSLTSYRHDDTAPDAVATVTHAAVLSSTSASPPISWGASADTGGSGLSQYEYSIGTTAGGTNIKGWTATAALATTATATGLILTTNTTYYVNVRAQDLAGNYSAVTSSTGWLADTTSPVVSIDSINDGDAIGPSVNLVGTCEANRSLTVTTSDGYEDPGSITCDAFGSYSVTLINSALLINDGDPVDITVQQSDAAGNSSSLVYSMQYDSGA